MSALLPNEKLTELIETLNKAGHEVEALKVTVYDGYFVVIELQISGLLNYKLTELAKALFSAGYQIEVLKPVYEKHFDGFGLKIIQTDTTNLTMLRKYLSGVKGNS